MPDYDDLRGTLRASIARERSLLKHASEMVNLDIMQRGIETDFRQEFGVEMPPDIDGLLREITKLRRTRYMQSLRALLDELSHEM